MADTADVVLVSSVQGVIYDYYEFFVLAVVSVSGIWCYVFSSESNPDICRLKLNTTGSAFCSINIGETLLNGSILCKNVFVHLSFLSLCDTVRTGSSVCSVLGLSCLCCHGCFSAGHSTSSVSKNT